MAPRKKFSKQDIINAAFKIARKEGLDAITIRKVAGQLGSSIAPIYVNFKDVEELIQAVVDHTQEVAKQLVLEQNSGHPFRDIGIGGIKFAREYNVLYRDLIMKNNPHMQHNEESLVFAINQMKQDPSLHGFTDEELKDIILKMDIFHTGLAVQVANGLLPEYVTEEKMIDMLDSVAEDVIIATRVRQKENQ
ncbi:TetR/AcrR family transcriptional regulator [Pseudogracilibacillus sp. SO30301A]|uniref:TetR/AcrR family transcriptional regulator n=1 Tax=Pseudogracilibacillus sp. SO30301A TaxID=3098291 RepID=UPI00300E0427